LKAKETVGIDSSDAMINKAKTFEAKNLSFVKENIVEWRTREVFDVVYSNAALQWCPEHVKVFSKIKESLRDGGQVAVQMPMNQDYPTHVIAAKMSEEEPWLSLLNQQKYSVQEFMQRPEQYAEMLFKLGFKKQKVFVQVYGHILESREEVVEWVKGSMLSFFMARLSEEKYGNFLNNFTEKLFKEIPDERPFFYPFKRIFIWAKA